PIRLRCEYRENPLGVDVPSPRLSWWLEPDDLAAKDLTQTGYQIVANSDDRALWDSGRVGSSQNIHVPYAGRPLQPLECVKWKVRVWDQNGHRSEWSDEATWTMGLIAPRDWQAKWITAPPSENESRLPVFRASFKLDQPITRAIVFYCGLGQHE